MSLFFYVLKNNKVHIFLFILVRFFPLVLFCNSANFNKAFLRPPGTIGFQMDASHALKGKSDGGMFAYFSE